MEANSEKNCVLLVIDIQQEDFMELREEKTQWQDPARELTNMRWRR